MSYLIKKYKRGAELPEWEGSHYFHSNTFFHLCESSHLLSPKLFVAEEDGVVKGRLLVVIIRESNIFFRSLLSIARIISEPEILGKGEEAKAILKALVDTFIKEVASRTIYCELRNMQSTPLYGYKAFRDRQFIPVQKLFVQNNFKKPREIFQQLSASKKRQVKMALHSGTQVCEASSIEEIDLWFRRAHQFYSPRLLRHLPPVGFFHHFFLHTQKEGKGVLFFAKYNEKIIGGMACIFSEDTMYEWYVGTAKKRYTQQFPGVLLTLHALEYCQEKGFAYFNFMDATAPFHSSGVREFKLQFGGKQRKSMRWYRFRFNWINKILSRIYV